MGKTHFCFGASFFVLATCGTLLLTWTCWWLWIVGPSVPARRPFYNSLSDVPPLVREASSYSSEPIFMYSLAGGWPTRNSIVRLLASALAVLCSFSFSFVATIASQAVARLTFCTVLVCTTVVSLVAAGCDLASIISTARECAASECRTEVPKQILDTGHICQCNVDGWFYFTLLADIVLFVSAICCVVLTIVPILKRRGVDPAY
ncbi:unnamed protein product [Agarophyton chilense]